MRRQRRYQRKANKFVYVVGSSLLFFIILFIILSIMYNKKLNSVTESMLSPEDIIGLNPSNKVDETAILEEASAIISKTIEETTNQIEETNSIEENNSILENVLEEASTQVVEETPKVEPKKELLFSYPVEGEILKEFSMETLIFSETLQEWTVHQGIDIKANRTTMVKSSEEGTVVAIKNDPRYGLSIIIEHEDGYKTVYSNLLAAEFVTEGEKVEKGQSLGTVGNSASFEIADEPHLHFEIIKDGQYVNPKTLLK